MEAGAQLGLTDYLMVKWMDAWILGWANEKCQDKLIWRVLKIERETEREKKKSKNKHKLYKDLLIPCLPKVFRAVQGKAFWNKKEKW